MRTFATIALLVACALAFAAEIKIYECRKCSVELRAASIPSAGKCEKGAGHSWCRIADAGFVNYQCRKCDRLLKRANQPQPGKCPMQGGHQWFRHSDAGYNNYQCGKCNFVLRGADNPQLENAPRAVAIVGESYKRQFCPQWRDGDYSTEFNSDIALSSRSILHRRTVTM